MLDRHLRATVATRISEEFKHFPVTRSNFVHAAEQISPLQGSLSNQLQVFHITSLTSSRPDWTAAPCSDCLVSLPDGRDCCTTADSKSNLLGSCLHRSWLSNFSALSFHLPRCPQATHGCLRLQLKPSVRPTSSPWSLLLFVHFMDMSSFIAAFGCVRILPHTSSISFHSCVLCLPSRLSLPFLPFPHFSLFFFLSWPCLPCLADNLPGPSLAAFSAHSTPSHASARPTLVIRTLLLAPLSLLS